MRLCMRLLAFALVWSAAGRGYASAVIMSLHSLSHAKKITHH